MLFLTVINGNRFQRGEAIKRFETLFTTMPRSLHAAERQLDTAASTIIIDEDLTGMDRMGEPELTSTIIGPDSAHETIGRAVGNGDCFFFRIEWPR